MFLIGRGGRAREAYPETNRAVIPFQNRLIAPPSALVAPFTPATAPNTSLIGAGLVTPKASGLFILLAELLVLAASVDTFAFEAVPGTGPGLTVSGGSATVGGWTFGTTVPPVIGGGPVVNNAPFGLGEETISNTGTLIVVGINDTPLPIGVPSVIQLFLGEVGGGNAANALVVSASLVEIP